MRQVSLVLRKSKDGWYWAGFDGKDFWIAEWGPPSRKWPVLAGTHNNHFLPGEHRMAFTAIGDELTLRVNGVETVHVHNKDFQAGQMGIGTNNGVSTFREVEGKIFDGDPPAAH